MRVDLRLQSLDLSVFLSQLLLVDPVHQCVDAAHHVVKGFCQLPDLIPAFYIQAYIQVLVLHGFHGAVQLVQWPCDGAGQEPKQDIGSHSAQDHQ